LLASPHYGERWGRHWLDAARYADSNGFNIDAPRSIWKYRDWVIDALNRDMPFDQFTVEQIAGDMLPPPTSATSEESAAALSALHPSPLSPLPSSARGEGRAGDVRSEGNQGGTPSGESALEKIQLDRLIATGFHRNTLINQEGGIDLEQFRVESVVDRVATTGAVFLGLTLGCAQCHDHKYDPISQREFYRFFAFFTNADEPDLELAPPDPIAQRNAIRSQ